MLLVFITHQYRLQNFSKFSFAKPLPNTKEGLTVSNAVAVSRLVNGVAAVAVRLVQFGSFYVVSY